MCEHGCVSMLMCAHFVDNLLLCWTMGEILVKLILISVPSFVHIIYRKIHTGREEVRLFLTIRSDGMVDVCIFNREEDISLQQAKLIQGFFSCQELQLLTC